ncbi:MAG: hypothetical protein ABIH49_03515 [archaeon]
MRFIGFNFSKISVEKHSDNFKDLKINTSIDVSEIKPTKADFLATKEEIVGMKFKYDVDYTNTAKIELEGNLVAAMDSKEAKNLVKQWKDKKIPPELRAPIFNLIIKKSTIKALELEEEVNLPSHISLPSVKMDSEK